MTKIIKRTNPPYCSIFATNYASSLKHIDKLTKIARQDFPALKKKDIRIRVLSGRIYGGMLSIEFKATGDIPKTYNAWFTNGSLPVEI